MRSLLILAAVAFSAAAAYSQTVRIGEIEFFGHSGLDIAAVRKALPVREGDQVSRSLKNDRIKDAARQVTGLEPTDVAAICCDNKGELMLYIGLGKQRGDFKYSPAPTGTSRFPKSVNKLYDQAMDAMMRAVQKGTSNEDDSNGYALDADRTLRSRQLAMREYALAHKELILQVLGSSSDDQQRVVASALLG